MLLKHGARIDVEARMCWPGPHNQNCEQRGKYSSPFEPGGADQRSSDRLQSAVYYAIDGDQVRRALSRPGVLTERDCICQSDEVMRATYGGIDGD